MKFFGLFIFFFSSIALAQLDPSMSNLLGQGSSDQSLDSSRYRVKPRKEKPVKRVLPEKKPTPTPTPEPTPTPTPKPQPAKVEKPVPVKLVEEDPKEETRIHYDDPRLNLVEVSIAPGLMYIDSTSQSWYRDYFSFSPSLSVQTRVWVTSEFGLQANYGTSLAADISTEPTSTEKTATEHRNFGAGLLWRYYASASRKASSYTFGLGYDDYQLVVPRTESSRIRLGTSGPVLSLAARIPSTKAIARTFAIDLLPRLRTDEESTQVTFSSGELDSAHGVAISIGSEYVIDRKQQFFWKLKHRVDKHVYEGASSANDPITGTTLSGVSVTKGTTQFVFGFSWGD